MTPPARLTRYQARLPQGLRNVFLPAATLIRIDKGEKRLWWQEQALVLTGDQWLAVPAGSRLTFLNQPGGDGFASRALSLHLPPPLAWCSDGPAPAARPCLTTTPALTWCFERVAEMSEVSLCQESAEAQVTSLYAELRAMGALSLLFPGSAMALSQRLADLMAQEPGAEHTLATLAPHLAMSRATLTRHLAAEGVTFTELLARVRMSHALTLLQQQLPPREVALACGYRSVRRFAECFRGHFGLTPQEYLHTCPQ
ncbi:helix-turn-helix transcriptional regulator [Aeromonas simiae]|uniref:helix-turn-helix transcriptional regulator n=1 Tax=Aeromonas simiae TaxID=218936 RepID=UPI00266BED7C|nr:helix-turn-helix transcriptional regulator [Aeromonas simiae]MDO2947393.1 helix-turn-helix transcriptional regulator [Aeromonas simiae]MDO2951058.1 helix-turn-helix transcriptional regulator [Aeromonas simiae]MDO2954651.1 helix-turn-helix transcriptional regulator [Aeromonas simiae]